MIYQIDVPMLESEPEGETTSEWFTSKREARNRFQAILRNEDRLEYRTDTLQLMVYEVDERLSRKALFVAGLQGRKWWTDKRRLAVGSIDPITSEELEARSNWYDGGAR